MKRCSAVEIVRTNIANFQFPLDGSDVYGRLHRLTTHFQNTIIGRKMIALIYGSYLLLSLKFNIKFVSGNLSDICIPTHYSRRELSHDKFGRQQILGRQCYTAFHSRKIPMKKTLASYR